MDFQLQTLSHDAYLALRSGATVIERDGHGDKVLQLTNGSYLKLFRRKRLISSAAWYPYAERFADNAIALKQRGIACPVVIAVYRVPNIKRDAVLYHPLEGLTLRQLIQSKEIIPELRTTLGKFIAQLHAAGVYFRSLHLGNIVLGPSGKLGLIDISDLRASPKPVSSYFRHRNFRQLGRDPQDREWLFADDSTEVEDAYLSAGQTRS
jgi:hypothetical protein